MRAASWRAVIRGVEADYDAHAEGARAVALSHFDGGLVLGELLDRAGLR